MERINRKIELENGEFSIDLFPYKIKNRELFYFRDHPKDISPTSFTFKRYWEEFLRYSLEGRWIRDEDGTWVFMMPKLFFYINYVPIVNENREKINPRLMDNGWIMATYSLCAEGFSGFDGDPDYTCNEIIKKVEEVGIDGLQRRDLRKLEEASSVKKPDGTYKKYIDAWTYLTEVYLITDKRDHPLGQALYDNPYYNEMVLAARGVHKSFWQFCGNYLHEFLFGNIRRFEDRHKINNPVLMALTSSKSKALSRSIANLSRAYTEFPGQYIIQRKNSDDTITYGGPFYKKVRGSWNVSNKGSSEVEHIVKEKSGKVILSGSLTQIISLVESKPEVLAGDRFRMMIVEECGFTKNLKDLHAANKDSLSYGGNKVGKVVYIGTGGNMNTIKDAKDMFENPEGYDIYPIPNYFSSKDGAKCGLFVSVVYQSEDLKDKNGNTYHKDSLADVLNRRIEKKKEVDTVSFGVDVMFNPLYPKELLRPNTKSPIPKNDISDWRHEITLGEERGEALWQRKLTVGRLGIVGDSIVFEPDHTLRPITTWGKDSSLEDKSGAWLLHEEPIDNAPEGLYYIMYDPIQQSGEGTSLQSIIVYKAKVAGDYTKDDKIVASYVGRNTNYGQGDLNFYEPIKAAKFYNAKIFSENNSSAFADYVIRNGLEQYTMAATRTSIRLAFNGKEPKNAFRFGVKVNEESNYWSLNKMAEWLLKPVVIDDDGIVLKRNYHYIYDPRLLDELVHFDIDDKTNFDMVSALMLLPYITVDLGEEEIRLEEEDAWEATYSKYDVMRKIPERKVAKINQY